MSTNTWHLGAVLLAGLIAAAAGAPSAFALSEVPAPGKTDALPVTPQVPAPAQPQQVQPQQVIPGVTIEVAPSAIPRPGMPEIGLQSDQIGKSIDIHIPGMGSVGVLPKFDLGLELLYTPRQDPVPEDTSKDDVIIKGTLKHRF
jgi:hypothetical protein